MINWNLIRLRQKIFYSIPFQQKLFNFNQSELQMIRLFWLEYDILKQWNRIYKGNTNQHIFPKYGREHERNKKVRKVRWESLFALRVGKLSSSCSFFSIFFWKYSSWQNLVYNKMNYNIIASLDKLTCNDYVDFGKNEDRFGRLSWAQTEKKRHQIYRNSTEKTSTVNFANINKSNWENQISNNFCCSEIKLLLLLRILRRMRNCNPL